MRTHPAWRLSAFIAFHAIALAAFAQQPPKLEKLEEGDVPEVTIRKPEQKNRVEEKRAPGGKVTEVKVTSSGGTYVLKANDQTGTAAAGDLQGHAIRAPQWEVKEFDFSRQKTKEQEEAQAPVPPPQVPKAVEK